MTENTTIDSPLDRLEWFIQEYPQPKAYTDGWWPRTFARARIESAVQHFRAGNPSDAWRSLKLATSSREPFETEPPEFLIAWSVLEMRRTQADGG